MVDTGNILASLPEPGEVIAGKYRVEGLLGAGGMGAVVAASHLLLKQRVAIKFLQPAALQIPGAGPRFLREAQAAVAIQNEHVARVLDLGTLDDGAPYMVMEYLVGMDLENLLKQRGPLPVAEAVDYVLQACTALSDAHGLGIVHRDVKPSNLFLATRTDGSSIVKVLDFGLSKMMDSEGSAGELTATEVVVGSPKYMSPEQVRSLKRVDARTDIWALGVVLYRLLTGRHPFNGPSAAAICAAIAADAPVPMSVLRADLPPALEDVVFQCLEKRPERRPQSAAVLAERLSPFASPATRPLAERLSARASRESMSSIAAAALQVDSPSFRQDPSSGPVSASSPVVAAPGAVPGEPGPRLSRPSSAPVTAATAVPVSAVVGPDPTTIGLGAWGAGRAAGVRPPVWKPLLVVAGAAALAVLGGLAWAAWRQPVGTPSPAAQDSAHSEPPSAPAAAAGEPTGGVVVTPSSATETASAAPGAPPSPPPASDSAAASAAPSTPPPASDSAAASAAAPTAPPAAPSAASTAPTAAASPQPVKPPAGAPAAPRPARKAPSNPLDRSD